ncbi:hypothetical protein BD414DRAFT_537537 [Trametes punicea]|nr:hypothetical protein BD414DRAFT_537537 [Trametes punicea]
MQSWTFDDFPSLKDDWQELVTQIENLGTRPAARATNVVHRNPPPLACESGKFAGPHDIPIKTPRRAVHNTMAPSSKRTSREARAFREVIKPVLTRDVDSDAREREKFRKELADRVPPTPEVWRKQPFTLPAAHLDQGRSGNDRGRPRESIVNPSGETTVTVNPVRSQAKQRFSVEIRPDTKHTTIWDEPNDDVWAWSGILVVTDAQPPAYFFTQHIIQDVWIHFYTLIEPRSDPPVSASPCSLAWETTYTGHHIPPGADSKTVPALKLSKGIAIEKDYQFLMPEDPEGPFTWLVRFWVPVPIALFARAEHKAFVCSAKVTVKDSDTPRTEVVAERLTVGIDRVWSERLLAMHRGGPGAMGA